MSFLRHSVLNPSDQVRMGWAQDRPEFQHEVGYANLAIGLVSFVAALYIFGLIALAGNHAAPF